MITSRDQWERLCAELRESIGDAPSVAVMAHITEEWGALLFLAEGTTVKEKIALGRAIVGNLRFMNRISDDGDSKSLSDLIARFERMQSSASAVDSLREQARARKGH